MNSLWSAPVLALVAIALGLPSYITLNRMGALPLALRDHPWPMELAAAVITAILIVRAVRAFRERINRKLFGVCAVLAFLSTLGFALAVNVAAYDIPRPPASLATGTAAPDFTLPDETGQSLSLASLRGHRVVLVFYRGFW